MIFWSSLKKFWMDVLKHFNNAPIHALPVSVFLNTKKDWTSLLQGFGYLLAKSDIGYFFIYILGSGLD